MRVEKFMSLDWGGTSSGSASSSLYTKMDVANYKVKTFSLLMKSLSP